MKRIFILAFCLATAANDVHAVQVAIDFNDTDGPHWTGIVDTQADTLTINSWVENPGGTSFWTPASLPLVWPAVDGAGSAFDVSDTFASSLFDSDFGFVSPEPVETTAWEEGVAAFKTKGYAGWGGTRTDDRFDVSATAETFGPIPISSTAGELSSGTVTVSIVPEPTGMVLSLCFFGWGLAHRRIRVAR